VLNRVSKCFLTMAIAGGMTVTSLPAQSQDQSQRQAGQTAQGQPAQGQAGEAVKNWKDRAEYDLYRAIVNEQDPASVRLRREGSERSDLESRHLLRRR